MNMTINNLLRAATMAMVLGGAVQSAQAQNRVEDMPEIVTARILPGWRDADGHHFAAIQIDLAEGWKTYWRAPGSGGIPPVFKWRGSRNVEAVRLHWPTPRVYEQDGIMSVGYKHQLILPVEVVPSDASARATLVADIEFGVCKDVCMPVTARITGRLPADAGTPDGAISAALADQPQTAQQAGVGRVTCSIAPRQGGFKVEAKVDVPSTGGRETAILEYPDPNLWIDAAETSRSGNQLTATTTIMNYGSGALVLDRSLIRLTVIGKQGAVDISGCPAG